MIQIDSDWTLFLDRDGVINEEIKGYYVTHPDEFVFNDGALETIAQCSLLFKRILIVTNQRGVGRGIMSVTQLNAIHEKMLTAIRCAGGEIQRIYYAPDINDDAANRKPNTGMALQALDNFPDIDFNRSIMVGNSLSDITFGRQLGMQTVFVPSTKPDLYPHSLIDYKINTFADFLTIIEHDKT